jgi:hypothetical protein
MRIGIVALAAYQRTKSARSCRQLHVVFGRIAGAVRAGFAEGKI